MLLMNKTWLSIIRFQFQRLVSRLFDRLPVKVLICIFPALHNTFTDYSLIIKAGCFVW